jgi:hypothetical protein
MSPHHCRTKPNEKSRRRFARKVSAFAATATMAFALEAKPPEGGYSKADHPFDRAKAKESLETMEWIWEEGNKYCYTTGKVDHWSLRNEATGWHEWLLQIGDSTNPIRPYHWCATAAFTVALQMDNCRSLRSASWSKAIERAWNEQKKLCKAEIGESKAPITRKHK